MTQMAGTAAAPPAPTTFGPHVSRHSVDSADVIIPILREYMEIGSVIDFGCKHGEWLRGFRNHGATRVFGLDRRNKTELLLIDPSEFRAADFSQPIGVEERYDLAVCIEVAEHLPEAAAAPLVRTLTEVAPVVLFSAAVPEQGGHGHLNEQPRGYWTALFEARGFKSLDCIRPRIWQDPRVAWWYRQNLFLYASADAIRRSDALGREAERPIADDMDILHKDVIRRRASIRASLRQIADSAKRFRRPSARRAE